MPAFSKLKSVDGMSHQSGLKKSSSQTQKNNNESQELVRNNTVPLFLKAPGAQADTIKDRLRGMKDPIVSFREKVIDIDSQKPSSKPSGSPNPTERKASIKSIAVVNIDSETVP